jgi:ADP-heptose:LPS heptosyltransferase
MLLPGPFNNILLLCIGGIGDIVMMTPVIRALKEKYPASRISVLTIPRSFETAKTIGGIDRLYTLPMVYKQPSFCSFFKVLSVALLLRKQTFDLLINLRATETYGGKLKMRFLIRLIGAKVSIGRNIGNKGDMYDFAFPEKIHERVTEVELTARLLEPLGIHSIDTRLRYEVARSDRLHVDSFLAGKGIDKNDTLVGINPGAFRPSRRWPMEHWKTLIGLITSATPSCRIFITGEAGERAFASAMPVSENVYLTLGTLTIGQLAALCERMKVFITNDTGPMHLAAAVGTMVVALFGPGDVNRFRPSVPEDQYRVVRKETVPCTRPCYEFHCPDPVCLTSLSPMEVMRAVEDILGWHGKRPDEQNHT